MRTQAESGVTDTLQPHQMTASVFGSGSDVCEVYVNPTPELESHPSRHLTVPMQVFRSPDQKLKHFGMDTCNLYLMCLLWAGTEGRTES